VPARLAGAVSTVPSVTMRYSEFAVSDPEQNGGTPGSAGGAVVGGTVVGGTVVVVGGTVVGGTVVGGTVVEVVDGVHPVGT
jgi:hypothetical protein